MAFVEGCCSELLTETNARTNDAADESVTDRETAVTRVTHLAATVHKAAGKVIIEGIIRGSIKLEIYTQLSVGVVVPVLSGRAD